MGHEGARQATGTAPYDTKRVVAAAFGAVVGAHRPPVHRYHDEARQLTVDVAEVADRPKPGLTTWSTLNLHLSRHLRDGRDCPVELMAVGRSEYQCSPNLLASAAFLVVRDGWTAAPGAIFPELVSAYSAGRFRMRHVMWRRPTDWPVDSAPLADGRTVRWLQAMAIDDAEYHYALHHGSEALATLLYLDHADPTDLARRPVC